MPASNRRKFPRLRFSLKAAFVVTLVCALLIAWAKDRYRLERTREVATVRIEVYKDRASFEKRLGGLIRSIDFDDIDTTKSDVVPFLTTRYASRGIHIKGTAGQFAGRTFGHPEDYPAASQPNSYAPGPKTIPGAKTTDVTFTVGKQGAMVTGFGVTFIDEDYSGMGPSSLTAYGWADRQIGVAEGFCGTNGSKIFRGLIAVDSNGNPIPAISRVQLINGTGWPDSDAGDGVTLDDMVFGVPQPDGL